MTEKNSASKTLVDVYEACLSRPLKTNDLLHSPLCAQELSKLADAVANHYRNYKLPTKSSNELRPYISPGFETSQTTGLSYVSGAGKYRNESGDQSKGEMTAGLIRFLAYCNSIAIQDPLPYLLDYFADGRTSEYSVARIPAVNALLCEYAELAELLIRRMVLPVSEPSMLASELTSLNDAFLTRLESRIPDLKPANIQFLLEVIRLEQYRRRRLNDEVDLYFPHSDYIVVLREFLKLNEEQFGSKSILEPFALTVLGSVTSLNPDSLSVKDIVRIRLDDELFAEWRAFLGDVFQEMESNENNYTSLDDEYAHTARQEFLRWKERFNDRLEQGSLMHALKQSRTNISIGMVAGAIGGISEGPSTAIVSAIGGGALGLIQPAIETLKNIVHANKKRAGALTLRHHFLAMGLSEDEF